MPPQSILEAILGGAGQGLQFAGQNLLPFRQQQLQNRRQADEVTATAGFREDQLTQGQSRIDLQQARDEEARQQNLIDNLSKAMELTATNNALPDPLTKSEAIGQFLSDPKNASILERMVEAEIANVGRRNQPAAVTPAAPTGGVDEATARAFGKTAQEGFLESRRPRSAVNVDPFTPAVLDSSTQVGINAFNQARGSQSSAAPPQTSFDNDTVQGLIARQMGMIAPENEGTVDQLERLFPQVSPEIERWGKEFYDESWNEASSAQKKAAYRKYHP